MCFCAMFFCVWTFINCCILIVSLCDCHTHSLKATWLDLTWQTSEICNRNTTSDSWNNAEWKGWRSRGMGVGVERGVYCLLHTAHNPSSDPFPVYLHTGKWERVWGVVVSAAYVADTDDDEMTYLAAGSDKAHVMFDHLRCRSAALPVTPVITHHWSPIKHHHHYQQQQQQQQQ